MTGEFDYADVSGMPAGLAFHIEYLANAVQLQVVTKPIFSTPISTTTATSIRRTSPSGKGPTTSINWAMPMAITTPTVATS